MALSLPPFTRSPQHRLAARVVSHTQIIGNEYEIVLDAPEIAACARPGHFLEVMPGAAAGAVTPRPFSLYRADPDTGACSVLYLARGSFTSDLASREVGDLVQILGPLGRPFSWDTDPDVRHILVAGGIGAPPIFFLARDICVHRTHHDPRGVAVINAARTGNLLVSMQEFGGLNITLQAATDDGTIGIRGVATELLEALLDECGSASDRCAIYACGPKRMLRAVGEIAVTRGVRCQLSVETPMPCGIGECGECVIEVHDPSIEGGLRPALACMEGPVFEARDIVWST